MGKIGKVPAISSRRMEIMHIKIRKKIGSLIAAAMVLAVSAASFTGCDSKETITTEGMRDGNDINTVETTAETEPTNTPTSTNTPTPTPSPTPSIPHMNKPEVDKTAPMFLARRRAHV